MINSPLALCAVEDNFKRPAVPLRGHLPDDITGHRDGPRRPQPGAARLQTPGQSAGSPSFGQHLPAHLHDRGGSTGRPLHHHVAGMVGGALPAEAPSQDLKGRILTGGGLVCVPGIFPSIQQSLDKKICPTWRTAACLCCLVSSSSSWPWWSPKVTLTRNPSTTTVSEATEELSLVGFNINAFGFFNASL